MTMRSASGSSTRNSICRPVIPIPRAARTTLAVDLAHPHVRVGEQRRYGEQDEGDDGRALALLPDRGEEQQDQYGEGGDGAADVGDVDGERAALAEMAEDEGDRQRDQTADDQADDGQDEVLAEPVPDAVGARPVARSR